MPPLKPKPSDIAVEAKRTYIPYIEQKYPDLPAKSYVHSYLDPLSPSCRRPSHGKLRVAVIDGDAVDVALDWYEYESKMRAEDPDRGSPGGDFRIPIVNMANEKRAGGDWESGLMAPEENLARRSNLVHCLTTPWDSSIPHGSNYPIPLKGGIYSPYVGTYSRKIFDGPSSDALTTATVVFRSGADRGYNVWSDFKWLPVISVAPIRRPKLDETGENYSFEQEKDLMKEKIRSVLRIARSWNHRDVCIGAFGAGPGFRNPVKQLASMWRDILFTESEFQDVFSNIVFAIESTAGGSPSSKLSDYEVFKNEFDASKVIPTIYR